MGVISRFGDWTVGLSHRFNNVETIAPVERKFIIDDLRRDDDNALANVTIGSRVQVLHAIRCSTVLCCARVIAEGLAQVPCRLLRKENGKFVEAVDHPLFDVLGSSPNEYQTIFEYIETKGLHASLLGNAYSEIARDTKGRVTELHPLHPNNIEVERDGYVTSYKVKGKDGTKRLINAVDMWHFRGPSWNGIEGLDAVRSASEAIGLHLATEQFGSKLFQNGARPSGILTTEHNMTPEELVSNQQAWDQAHQGSGNAHKTAVLSGGLNYQTISTNPDDAQFLETRKHQIEEICRFFRVLPIMVMSNENSTSYNSVESMMLAHLTHTLGPWFERFEKSAEKALLTAKERRAGYVIRLDAKGLLKGSAVERMTYLKTAIETGVMTRNEARENEGLERVDDESADKLTPAAHLFGNTKPNGDKNDE